MPVARLPSILPVNRERDTLLVGPPVALACDHVSQLGVRRGVQRTLPQLLADRDFDPTDRRLLEQCLCDHMCLRGCERQRRHACLRLVEMNGPAPADGRGHPRERHMERSTVRYAWGRHGRAAQCRPERA
eukprot:1602233-Prymnesium_polylepis.1